VREIWNRYQNNPNYYFSLILFPKGAGTDELGKITTGFIQGPGDSYFPKIANPAGLTPMKDALVEAKRQITEDLLRWTPGKGCACATS